MQASGAPPTTLSARQVRLIFGSLMTAMAMAALDGTIVNTALLTIVSDLGGLKSYAWVGTAYLLCSTISTMLMGKLSDIFGRRRLFLIAMVVFVAGSAMCGLARSMVQLVVARGLQGVGGGGLISMTFAITGDIVSPRERGKYSSLMTSVFAVAGVVGPLLGGIIVQNASWRLIFWVNVPIGTVALVLAWKVLHVPFERRDRPIDYVGAGLLTLGVSSLLVGFSWASQEYGWSAPPTLGLIVGSGVVLIVFGFWEARVAEPLIPLALFRIPIVRATLVAIGLMSSVLYAANTFLPLFLQGVTGVTPMQSGLLLVPIVFGILVSASIVGRLISRTGHYRRWSILGCAVMVPATAALSFVGQGGIRMAIMLGGMLTLGLAAGASNPVGTIAIQNAVDPADMGVASALSMFVRTLMSTIALSLFGTLMSSQLGDSVDPELVRSPRLIRALPPVEKAAALEALSGAIGAVYRWCIPLAIIALIASWRVEELPLRTTSRVGRHVADDSDGGFDPSVGAAIAH